MRNIGWMAHITNETVAGVGGGDRKKDEHLLRQYTKGEYGNIQSMKTVQGLIEKHNIELTDRWTIR